MAKFDETSLYKFTTLGFWFVKIKGHPIYRHCNGVKVRPAFIEIKKKNICEKAEKGIFKFKFWGK